MQVGGESSLKNVIFSKLFTWLFIHLIVIICFYEINRGLLENEWLIELGAL